MVPFGSVAYIERKKKNKKAISRSDPEPARVIGYPDDTPGWKFKIRGTTRPYVTSHAIFDASRTAEDRALARNSDSNTGFVEETTGAEGFPLGSTDTEIRRAATRYQTEIVRCSQPSERTHAAATRVTRSATRRQDTGATPVRPGKRIPRSNIMTDAEARHAIVIRKAEWLCAVF